jgi:hypothetical protein
MTRALSLIFAAGGEEQRIVEPHFMLKAALIVLYLYLF